jgi:hypothetical protein
MYKILAFILGLFTITSLSAQQASSVPVDDQTKLVTYKEVVQVKGTKDELYVRGIEWINTYYKNPTEVTRTRNREDGLIKGVARFKTTFTDKDGFKKDGPMIEYGFTFEFKDGRYRYIFTDMSRKEASRQPVELWLNNKDHAYNPQWDDYLAQIDAYFKTTLASLKKAMEPQAKKDDSW